MNLHEALGIPEEQPLTIEVINLTTKQSSLFNDPDAAYAFIKTIERPDLEMEISSGATVLAADDITPLEGCSGLGYVAAWLDDVPIEEVKLYKAEQQRLGEAAEAGGNASPTVKQSGDYIDLTTLMKWIENDEWPEISNEA